jgi:hypothetical protein
MRFDCSNDEDSRCHRLLRVLEFVHNLRAQQSMSTGETFDVFALEALEDHKGELIVHWGDIKPTTEQKTWFHVAWATVGSEPYENVTHEELTG